MPFSGPGADTVGRLLPLLAERLGRLRFEHRLGLGCAGIDRFAVKSRIGAPGSTPLRALWARPFVNAW